MAENLAPDDVNLDRSRPFWWRRLTDCDPISLEPLRRLRVEPFELAASEETSHSYFFDARLLASYLVSSGSFAHPISRRELTRDDCVRLDAHLRKHRLGKACVEHAWENKEDYKRQNAATSQVRDIQAEATELLRAFYAASGHDSGALRGGGRGGRGRGFGRGGGGGGEEAAARHDYVDEEEFVESVPLGGAQISSAADFPSLGDASVPPPAAATPLQASWLGRGGGGLSPAASGVDLANAEAFPSLGGAGRGGGAPLSAGGWGGRGGAALRQPAAAPAGGASLAAFAGAQGGREPPAVDSAEAFPSLGGGPAPRPSSSAAGVGGWSRAVASAAPAPPPTMAQTAFASAEPPPSIDSAEAFPTLGAAMRSGVPPARRLDRDELVRRNRSLQAALSGSLAGEGRERGMGLFKVASLAFQRGASDATAYIAAFVHVFGNEAALVHLPELIALCPDAPKQADLGRAFDVFRAERLAERGAAVERSAAGVGTFGRGGRSNGWGRGGRRGGG